MAPGDKWETRAKEMLQADPISLKWIFWWKGKKPGLTPTLSPGHFLRPDLNDLTIIHYFVMFEAPLTDNQKIAFIKVPQITTVIESAV